jgi:hypothetical protein
MKSHIVRVNVLCATQKELGALPWGLWVTFNKGRTYSSRTRMSHCKHRFVYMGLLLTPHRGMEEMVGEETIVRPKNVLVLCCVTRRNFCVRFTDVSGGRPSSLSQPSPRRNRTVAVRYSTVTIRCHPLGLVHPSCNGVYRPPQLESSKSPPLPTLPPCRFKGRPRTKTCPLRCCE